MIIIINFTLIKCRIELKIRSRFTDLWCWWLQTRYILNGTLYIWSIFSGRCNSRNNIDSNRCNTSISIDSFGFPLFIFPTILYTGNKFKKNSTVYIRESMYALYNRVSTVQQVLQTNYNFSAAIFREFPLTVKRRICILVLYYCEYVKWIRGGDECHEKYVKVEGTQAWMSGNKLVPYRPWQYLHWYCF